jgi:hypothetical protein
MIDFNIIKQSQKLERRIDLMAESSPISDYEMWTSFSNRIKHKQNLTYGELESRLKDIFKVMSNDIFIDRKETFKRIKKKLLGKHNINESKLAQYLKGETLIKENCEYIKNYVCVNDK